MNDGTRMRDDLLFEAPYGVFGRLAEGRLQRHLRKFLAERNALIKQVAESDEWRQYLEHQDAPTIATQT